MDKVYFQELKSDVCNFLIAYTKNGLVRVKFKIDNSEIEFFDFLNKHFNNIIEEKKSNEFIENISDFLERKEKLLDIPVQLIGSGFNKKVWEELIKIPYGELRTYKQIAEAIGCNKGYRAVGNANNNNPIVLIVPCHRVIGSNDSLTGFAPGIEYKIKLLELEGHMPFIKKNKWYVKNICKNI